MFTACVIIGLLLLLAGCVAWPAEQTEFIHVNSRGEAMKLAADWQTSAPGRTWTTAGACCGSMRPALYGGEILLIEIYTGQPLTAGKMAIFYRADGQVTTVHRVIEANGRAVYFSGDNNQYSDGWIPLSSVRAVVVRVVTFPR